MATAVIMPKFGMAQEEGTVIRWLKTEGERVEKGETLLEVQTDKVDMEVEAPGGGILHDIRVAADTTVPVTTVIAMILDDHEFAAITARPLRDATPAPTPLSIESPATKRLDVKASPVAHRVAVEQGVDLAKLTGTGPGGRITKADVEQQITQKPSVETDLQTDVRATPAARRLARERSLSLASIRGTGPDQRIQSADIIEHVAEQQTAATSSISEAVPPLGDGETVPAGGDSPAAIPLRGARKTIAQRLTQSWQSAPHIFLSTSVDMTKVEELRGRLQAEPVFAQARLTPTVVFAKAVAAALMLYRRLNAWLRPEGDALMLAEQGQVHLGIAVALPDGLIVPVIRHAEQLGLAALAQRIDTLAHHARQGTLAPDDVTGGTFTISNLGMYPVDHFTAIINPPQVAILAVGRTQIQPVWDGTAFQPCPVLQMTLSADHRAVDGAVAAAFLAELKRLLEEPTRMLL